MTLQERAAFCWNFYFFFPLLLLLSLVCLVPPRVCLHFAVAALQKQLLKLKYAVFVYYESDLPLRISITVLLLPVNPALTHKARRHRRRGEHHPASRTDKAADAAAPAAAKMTASDEITGPLKHFEGSRGAAVITCQGSCRHCSDVTAGNGKY